jgi:two-component system response regulator CpxR
MHTETSSSRQQLRADGGRTTVDQQDGPPSNGTVLVVDDEERFAESVGVWIDQHWESVVATDGEEALRKYGPHVDAVLLDRRMPRLSGDETLQRLRRRDGDARVAMLTALEPDLDVVDLDYDMYLEKPVDRREVVSAVEELLRRSDYSQSLQALYALSSKVAKLKSEYEPAELDDDPRFQRLQAELERVRERAGTDLRDCDEDEMTELLQVVDDART